MPLTLACVPEFVVVGTALGEAFSEQNTHRWMVSRLGVTGIHGHDRFLLPRGAEA
jgi:hypothetical protein